MAINRGCRSARRREVYGSIGGVVGSCNTGSVFVEERLHDTGWEMCGSASLKMYI